MSNGHLPSLHWDPDRQRWIPKRGFTSVEFPHELDPKMLPKPSYQIGERVRFSWYGSNPWEGEIRGVQIAGGEYDPYGECGPYNEAIEYAIQRKYLRTH